MTPTLARSTLAAFGSILFVQPSAGDNSFLTIIVVSKAQAHIIAWTTALMLQWVCTMSCHFCATRIALATIRPSLREEDGPVSQGRPRGRRRNVRVGGSVDRSQGSPGRSASNCMSSRSKCRSLRLSMEYTKVLSMGLGSRLYKTQLIESR
jgi:hypothetical protein